MAIHHIYKKVFPLILGILFTSILTWPLLTNITTFYKDKGDYPLVGWILWHNQKAITQGFIFDQEKYFDAGQFYPYPFNLAYSEHLFIPSIIFTIIYKFTNSLVFSINILFFISFVLSFISSYLVINYFLKDRLASIIGALIFTFNPLTFAHFADHFHLMNKYFLPPLFLFCYLFLIKTNFKNSILFFTFFTLNALASIHFGIFSLVIILILVATSVVLQLVKKNYQYILRLAKYTILVLLFLPILNYFNLPYLELSNKERVVRPLSETVYYSARLIDFVSPHPNSLAYGQLYKMIEGYRYPRGEKNYFNYSEHTLFTNIFPSTLFLAGLYFSIKLFKDKKKVVTKSVILFFLSIAVLSFIFSLGPLFTGWNSESGSFKLPYYIIYKWLPLIRAIRVPTRIEFIFYIPFSFFTALGFYYLCKNIKGNFKMLIFLATLMILFLENIHILSFAEKSQIIDRFDNESAKGKLFFLRDKNTIHLPISLNNDQNEAKYLTWATLTSEETFNGYSGYAPPDRNSYIEKIKNFDEKALEKISAIEIEYVILHKDLIPSYKDFYKKEGDFYGIGMIYENDEILIIDLKKYNFSIKKCKKGDNLLVQLISNSTYIKADENFYQLFPKIRLMNNNSCYYVSTFRQRYLPFNFNFKKDNIYIKLPILMEPREAVEIAL